MSRPEHIYEIYIRASAEAIWEAITTPAFTRQYFHAMDIDSTWETGAPVAFRSAEGQPSVEGRVIEARPPTRLSYTWRFLYDEELARERPSRVTYEIEDKGTVCRLRVSHDEFDPDSKVLAMISRGWAPILCSLKSLLETGEALAMDADAGTEEARGAA